MGRPGGESDGEAGGTWLYKGDREDPSVYKVMGVLYLDCGGGFMNLHMQ